MFVFFIAKQLSGRRLLLKIYMEGAKGKAKFQMVSPNKFWKRYHAAGVRA